jgi:hypothetical protein
MNIEYSHFWLSKSGNLPSVYEDSFFPYKFPFDTITTHIQKYQRYAIADGASTAYLSGLWATILVDVFGSYAEEITNTNFFDLIQKLILDEYWNSRLDDYIKKREAEGKPLSWYDEMALQNGAASTLLEISFSLEENKLKDKFSALAIGDSCLFLVRNDELITKFPLNSSADFDNSPLLISSESNRNLNLHEKIAYLENQSIITGDQIFLMTDALASWFFQEHEKGEKPWEIIGENVGEKYGFTDWIEQLRENKQMRNDDVTLMILKIQGDS